jgi:hypothetical protein
MWVAHTAYGLPFAIFLLRNFFGALPRDVFESAYLDGASDIGVFFRIVPPLSMPAIAALAIFQFLWVWQDLLVALVLLGDPELAPMMLTINSLVSPFGRQLSAVDGVGIRLHDSAHVHLLRPAALLRAGHPGWVGERIGGRPAVIEWRRERASDGGRSI